MVAILIHFMTLRGGNFMKHQVLLIASCFLLLFAVSLANATSYTFDVDATGNSSSGGTGLNTGISLLAGQLFSVTADPTDLWSGFGRQ